MAFLGVRGEGIRLNYTTILNIIFLGIGSLLLVRFLRTSGPRMLRMMNQPHHPASH